MNITNPSGYRDENGLLRLPSPEEAMELQVGVCKQIMKFSEKLYDADDAHVAIGLWWARKILKPFLLHDTGHESLETELRNGSFIGTLAGRMIVGQEIKIMPRISIFADKLTDLSRELGDPSDISVDYHADETLMKAAELAQMKVNDMIDFPSKTHTVLMNGRVMAGNSEASSQIWPPPPLPIDLANPYLTF